MENALIFLRSAFYLISFYIWSAFMMLLFIPTVFGPRALVMFLTGVWAKGVLFLLRFWVGIRWRVEGAEYLVDGPALYAAKHQSAWETIALWALLRRPCFVLKRELYWIPVFGIYLWKQGHVAVDRSAGASALKRMVKRCRELLDQGKSIIIFPEGTRRAPGLPPRYMPGVAALYKELQMPVIPMALDSGYCWGRNSFLKRPGVITLHALPHIQPGMDRKQFMQVLEEKIETACAKLPGNDLPLTLPLSRKRERAGWR